MADLVQAIHDADAALRSASVTCDYRFEQWDPFANRFPGVTDAHGVCSFDASGRCRFEGHGVDRMGSGKGAYTLQYNRLDVFDGSRMKSLEGNGERYLRARVGEAARVQWPVDPREYLYRFDTQPVAKILSEEGSSVVGTVLWDQRSATAVEGKTYVSEFGRTKYRFLIDCDHGFAVVRRSEAIYRPASKDWFDYHVIEGHGYSEVAPGIWLPSTAKGEGYPISATKLHPALINRFEVRNRNWVVNPRLPESEFDLDFPPAIVVTDDQTGKTYQTVKVRDGVITAQAAEGLEIYKEKKASFFWRRLFLWGGAAAATLVVLAVFLARRRHRRRSASQGSGRQQ
ncbi:MAG TPA: hypothetical protein VJ739_16110 [Gemmataceae bacterium]|nr:hypothetical protein [Gemmataceae bacterium]